MSVDLSTSPSPPLNPPFSSPLLLHSLLLSPGNPFSPHLSPPFSYSSSPLLPLLSPLSTTLPRHIRTPPLPSLLLAPPFSTLLSLSLPPLLFPTRLSSCLPKGTSTIRCPLIPSSSTLLSPPHPSSPLLSHSCVTRDRGRLIKWNNGPPWSVFLFIFAWPSELTPASPSC